MKTERKDDIMTKKHMAVNEPYTRQFNLYNYSNHYLPHKKQYKTKATTKIIKQIHVHKHTNKII